MYGWFKQPFLQSQPELVQGILGEGGCWYCKLLLPNHSPTWPNHLIHIIWHPSTVGLETLLWILVAICHLLIELSGGRTLPLHTFQQMTLLLFSSTLLYFWSHLVSINGRWSAWLTDWTWLAAVWEVGPKIAPSPGWINLHSFRLAFGKIEFFDRFRIINLWMHCRQNEEIQFLPWSYRPLGKCLLPRSISSDSSLCGPSQCFQSSIFIWAFPVNFDKISLLSISRSSVFTKSKWLAMCNLILIIAPYSPFLANVRKLVVLPLSHHQKEPLGEKLVKRALNTGWKISNLRSLEDAQAYPGRKSFGPINQPPWPLTSSLTKLDFHVDVDVDVDFFVGHHVQFHVSHHVTHHVGQHNVI